MKAAVRTRYGGPDTLQVIDVPKPVPGAGEVLVQVAATTVNRTDCGILTGRPSAIRLFTGLRRPRRRILGTDFAGQVVAIGDGVTKFQTGDRVMGFFDEGVQSQAEFMAFPADKAISQIPDGCSYETAAASLEGPHYARNILQFIWPRPGQRVLINGASGAIGSALVQLLKLENVHVTAVCSHVNADRVWSLGPDEVIEYDRQDFTKGSEKYEVVIDAVGKSSFGACRPILSSRGIYISSELGPRAENLYLPMITMFSSGQKVKFPFPTNTKKTVQMMSDLLHRRKYRPLIDQRFPLASVAEAYRYVMRGEKVGNVIVSMQ